MVISTVSGKCRIQVETVGEMAGVEWEGRPLAMSEPVAWRLGFWMVVHVDLQVPRLMALVGI